MSMIECCRSVMKSPHLAKVSAFVLVYVAFCYVAQNSSDADRKLLLLNYGQFAANISSSQTPTPTAIAVSPNSTPPQLSPSYPPPVTSPLSLSPSFPPPPQLLRPLIERLGILSGDGAMTDEFDVEDIDAEFVEKMGNGSQALGRSFSDEGTWIGVKRFSQCSDSMMDYVPCMDNGDAIGRLPSTDRGEQFERHCPEKDKRLTCLVPKPKGYKNLVPWPKSLHEVWLQNIPNTTLAEEVKGRREVSIKKDKLHFTDGRIKDEGIECTQGADRYISHLSQMVPDIAFGSRTRVVLDVACGIGNLGGYLMSRNVLTLCIAPKDVHGNEIQFALERGVPAMVATFATHRLLYPSQAFDMVHCCRCGVNWTLDDGTWLLEANRILRAGGYFVWSDKFEEQWSEMLDLAARLCWVLVKKEQHVAIWQKPLNSSCYLNRSEGIRPPLCPADDDPDNVWYVDLTACISQLPKNGSVASLSVWPDRLQTPPDRLETIHMDALISRKELFRAENRKWDMIIKSYMHHFHLKKRKLRNVLDMRAGFGGFAATLINEKIDAWVLNVVPVSWFNTLPIIYDRGLLGVMHDWCEPFDTYLRSYDLLHASGLFSIERRRCNISDIMLEMDRILRPGGFAFIHDSVTAINEVQEIGNAMGWHVTLRDPPEGPHAFYKILICEKRLKHRK
uniref:Methyltransferase n=1 Tax=Kalanchoe fedtschenkoi TaxID=63787 RepID=A0A7N0TPL4_KALFE